MSDAKPRDYYAEYLAKQAAAYRAQCEQIHSEYTVGRAVWRVSYGKVEEGKIERVSRGRYDSSGNFREDQNGEDFRYFASFGWGRWEDQGASSYEFWIHKTDAMAQLVRKLREDAKEKREQADKKDIEADIVEVAMYKELAACDF